MKVKKSKTRKILGYLAAGSGVALLSLVNPTLPHQLLKLYLRQKKFQRGRFLMDLRRLQRRELIEYREFGDGSVKITLKAPGKRLAAHYRFDELQIIKPRSWDRRWRLVMFDVPHEKRMARDALRNKLREMGFYQLQKSVFIYPFPCEKELEFVAAVLDVRSYMLIIVTSDFEGSDKLAHYYGLLKF